MAISFLRVSAVVAAASIAQNAHSQLYNNLATYQGAVYNLSPGVQAGNEIVLSGSAASDEITGFDIALGFSAGTSGLSALTGNESIDLAFYANHGPGTAPSTTYLDPTSPALLDTGVLSLGDTAAFGTGGFYGAVFPIDGFSHDVVPKDFTWTITISGLAAGETGGLALYSPVVAGEGNNYGDAWVGGPGSWELLTASPGNPPLEFGAEVFGTAVVPDSSSLSFAVLAIGAGFGLVKRSIRRQLSA